MVMGASRWDRRCRLPRARLSTVQWKRMLVGTGACTGCCTPGSVAFQPLFTSSTGTYPQHDRAELGASTAQLSHGQAVVSRACELRAPAPAQQHQPRSHCSTHILIPQNRGLGCKISRSACMGRRAALARACRRLQLLHLDQPEHACPPATRRHAPGHVNLLVLSGLHPESGPQLCSGRDVPEPRGSMATRGMRSRRRMSSRCQAATWLISQWDQRTVWAGWRCVKPGISTSTCRSKQAGQPKPQPVHGVASLTLAAETMPEAACQPWHPGGLHCSAGSAVAGILLPCN